MTALALLDVTLLPCHFLVALWAAIMMRVGYHFRQEQEKSRKDWIKGKERPNCVDCFHERQLDCIRPEAVTGKELHNPPERAL